jgi:hypothetical protein
MTVPIAARDIAAAAGAILVLGAVVSVVGTVIVPRNTGSRLTRLVTRVVNGLFRLICRPVSAYRRRDRIMAGPNAHGFFETAVLDSAAMAGLITVTLQIAYLPHLYAAFNRRENEIALLNSRAGMPSWGPELLARTHYALGSGTSALDTLPEFYTQWERWAADVTESHVTYSPLAWFRSPSHEASWVTALLSVLDSAALYLALCPEGAPAVPTRLCLRSGMVCFGEVARSMGLTVPAEPDPDAGISLGYDEFLDAVSRLNEVGFPIQREPEAAWPHFVGWRVNYEQAAYAIAEAVDAVPALWSGPRRRPERQIAPLRPGPGLSS